jgi:hypothetical protein
MEIGAKPEIGWLEVGDWIPFALRPVKVSCWGQSVVKIKSVFLKINIFSNNF